MNVLSRSVIGIATATACVGLIAGCSSSGSSDDPSPSSSTLPPSPLTLTDGVIAPAAKKGQNALLSGVFTNNTDEPVSVVGGASAVATQMIVVSPPANGKPAQQQGGGITVPANGKFTMPKDGRQLQFVKLTGPLKSGQVVNFAVIQSNGSSASVKATVK